MKMFSVNLGFLVLISVLGYASAPPPIPVVTIEKAKLSDLSDNLNYPARVESRVNSVIYSESEGVVTRIYAPLGSHVRKGGRVAVIKHTDPLYQYAPFVVTAPVDGYVSQVAVTEGTTVLKGAPLVSVTDPGQLRIIIEIAASDLASFKKGMEGTFQLSGSAEKIQVNIKGLSPFIDPTTGTAECDLTISQKEVSKLPPGSVGEAHFEINRRKGFVFPDNSIVYKGNDTFVRLVLNGVAKKIPVELGRRERGTVEILKGVKNGDQVIERASQFIADGDKVQVESGGG
jgi:multidrug efflux pump subunit AcrA (membrane-fusion protein)